MPTIQGQPMPFSQPMQQFPPRPSQPVNPVPSSQAISALYVQTNRPLTPCSPLPQNTATAMNNHVPGLGAPGMPLSSSYTFAPSPYGQPNASASSQFQLMPQMHAPLAPIPGQPWTSSANHSAPLVPPVWLTGQQPSADSSTDAAAQVPSIAQPSSCDWQEHTSNDGRRYYYNKRTKQSSWEKPLELMTPIERADASTVWKEFTTPEGKKYYYNKVTKQSKWSIPEELKLAREQAQMAVSRGTQSELGTTSNVSPAVAISSAETPATTSSGTASTLTGVAASPVSVNPAVAVTNPSPVVVSGSSTIPVAHSAGVVATVVQRAMVTPINTAVSGSISVPPGLVNANTNIIDRSGYGTVVSQDAANLADGATIQDIEEAKEGMAVAGKINVTPAEEKTPDDEPLVYANKLEAKNAFKALLESANVQLDWTWEQTMREIINDQRYGALRTPGERKQAFNEYLGQRKKLEAEEKRMRQKKVKEEFTKMLEESTELTSSMKWSKAVSMFENDERFKAVEQARDREDLFDSYMVELERKKKEKAAEDHRQNIAEYRKFLKSCDFIKVNSQWRKVQDRLEEDERCFCLEKIDRLIIYQDYIRDLEKEEEEQKKLQKEKLKRTERKNRDAFRKLMEEHVADGTLTAKTHWRDYCYKVKDLPQYQAVASNTSGSTPKDLYEDVAEELEQQYHEDKTHIKDAMKLGKITMASTWMCEDFKAAISEDVGTLPISDINFKLVYKELIERAKEKEEKEAKKRQRLADDFTELLYTCKEITPSSNWEDWKPLFEESQEYKSIGDESFGRQIFEEYILHLVEKATEKERRREEDKAKKEKEREEKEKRKEKERKEEKREREREKGKERTKKDESDSENLDAANGHGHKEYKRKEKDKDRKHWKRNQNAVDDASSDKDEREDCKKSRRHGSDRKKSRKHAYSPESDSESRHKKHKRDHRDSSHRKGGHEDLEDGEVGEDGEIH